MNFPLRKIIIYIAIIIFIILGVLLFFGIRQYQLQAKLETVVSQSEKIIFQFSNIREHIIQSIVDKKYDKLDVVVADIEKLHISVSDILNNNYIPNEYKLSLLNRIDLQGIILLIRQLSIGNIDDLRLQQLNRESRVMNERLIMFDRIIVDYAKSTVISFQSVVIGALAIVVFIVVLILVMVHKYIAIPLIRLVYQVRDVAQGLKNDIDINPTNMSAEIFNLGEAFHNLLQTRLLDSVEAARNNRILYAVHKAGLAISRSGTRGDLFNNVYKALRYNDDYCHVLICVVDESCGKLVPYQYEDPSVQIDYEDQLKLTNLIVDSFEINEKIYPAARAINENKAIVEYDVLAGLPSGHLKDTSFAQNQINCVALPLIWDNKTYGAIVIYSTLAYCFHNEEMKLLQKITSDVAFALSTLEIKRDLLIEKERFLAVGTALNIMTFLLEADGRIISCDNNVSSNTGLKLDELTGRFWQDLIAYRSDEDEQAFKQFFRLSEQEYKGKAQLPNKTGLLMDISCSLLKRKVDDSNNIDIFCICHDDSDLVRCEYELERISAEQHSLFNALPCMVFITSTDGIIHDLNDKAQENFKTERSILYGQDIFQYIYSHRPSDSPTPLKDIMLEKRKASLRERFDNLGLEFLVTVAPLVARHDKETRIILIINSISFGTEQRIGEIIRIFQLINLGELATGIAHEVNNLSNGIINYAQILADEGVERDCKLDQERMDLLNKIIGEGERIALIVKKLLFYSREKGKNKELIHIKDVLEDTLLLVKHQFKNDGIKVDLDLPEDLPAVLFESSKLQLIFLSLLNNSRRALNEKYSGKNENKRIELKGEFEIRNGKRLLKILITDMGIGISPQNISRIFDPIFTTKPIGEDGGMGLAISRQLLMENNGSISILSEHGNYTKVTVELPCNSAKHELYK